MQKKTKIAVAAGALAVALTAGAGMVLADGSMFGWVHYGYRGAMMGGEGAMNGGMGRGGMMDDEGAMMGGMGRGGMMEMRGGMGMGPGAHIDFGAADANQDGKLTEDELKTWQAAQVASIDADKDGKLSADEISGFAMAQVRSRIAEHASTMVARLDTDGDGLLSSAELLARPLAMPDFSRLDRNGDGSVTEDELQPQMPMPGAMGRGPMFDNGASTAQPAAPGATAPAQGSGN